MRHSENDKRLLRSTYLNQTSMGIYLLLIGAVLPLIRAEYGLSYRLSGFMMGLQSTGYFLAGLAAPVLPRRFGVKVSYLVLVNLAFPGLILIMVTGNPVLLLLAMLLTGISKGAGGNYNNAMVSNLTGNSASKLNFLQACFAIGACAAPLIAALCGTSWRAAFGVELVIAAAILLYSRGMKIRPEAYPLSDRGAGAGFGFFRSRVFWICAAFLSCYMAIEACIMGFLVTYYIDTGLAGESLSQMLSILLWLAVLAGRLACAALSRKYRPADMLTVMTAGVAASFCLFIFCRSLALVTIGSVGLGLFLAGMYGTAIGDVGDLLERYPLCMGMLIVIPGLISAILPGAVGILADRWDIRHGLMSVFVLIGLLAAVTTARRRQ